jgi:hypothetical protein
VEPHADVALGKGADEGVPVHPGDLHDEQVPRVDMGIRNGLRQIDPGDAGKAGGIPAREPGPAGVQPGDFAHLDHPDRRVEVGQVVLVPRFPDVVVRGTPLPIPLPGVPLDPVEPEQPKSRGEGRRRNR